MVVVTFCIFKALFYLLTREIWFAFVKIRESRKLLPSLVGSKGSHSILACKLLYEGFWCSGDDGGGAEAHGATLFCILLYICELKTADLGPLQSIKPLLRHSFFPPAKRRGATNTHAKTLNTHLGKNMS